MSAVVELDLERISGRFAVCRAEPGTEAPAPAAGSLFWSLSVTATEVSLVCSEDQVPEGFSAEPGWSALAVAGVLDFSLVGILAALTATLAEAKISVFAVSTFNTDVLLVRAVQLDQAVEALRAAGHRVQA